MTRAEPYRECPRFPLCACNDCPLDPMAAMHGGTRHALELEEPCRARRAARESIAARHGLPAGFAVLPRERNCDARAAAFAALPEGEQARRRTQLAEARKRAPAARKTGVFEASGSGRGDGRGSGVRSQNPVSRAEVCVRQEVAR
jgi:hypothetical protein